MKNNVTIILQVFNEDKTVYNVLHTLFLYAYFHKIKVVVVNDGSTDKSMDEIQRVKNLDYADRITIVNFKENKGKGNSIKHVFPLCDGKICVLVDSDLVGLKERHIKRHGKKFDKSSD